MKVSLIIPAFNEAQQVSEMMAALKVASLNDADVIFVDDGSTDNTLEVLNLSCSDEEIRILHRRINGGKTAAVRDGLAAATGEWVIVQDADLEFEPADIPRLLAVAQEKGGAVFGRRPSYWHRPSRWPFALGVLMVDLWLLILYRRWARDHATC